MTEDASFWQKIISCSAVRFAKKNERKEQLENRFKREIKQASKKRSEIYELIDGLDNPKQAEVLDQYFIQQKTLEAIAKDMHYSISYIIKLYRQGVETITIKEFGGGQC